MTPSRPAVASVGRALVLLGTIGTIGVAVIRYTGLQELGFRMMGIAGISVLATGVAASVSLAGATMILLADGRPSRRAVVALVAAALPVVLVVEMTSPALLGAISPERSTDGAGFDVLVQNLYFQNEQPAHSLDVVLGRDADVLVLLEFTPEFEALLDGRGDAEQIEDRYPYQWREPHPFGRGLAVLSSLPFERAVRVPLSEPAVMLDLDVGGVRVDLYALHPVAPSDRWGLREWQHDYRVLTEDARDARPETVMAGDFNATTGHRAFRRLLRQGSLRDAQDVAGGGLAGTWPVGWWIPPLMRLDHVLVGTGIGVERVELLEDLGSDHRGVHAWLRVPGDS